MMRAFPLLLVIAIVPGADGAGAKSTYLAVFDKVVARIEKQHDFAASYERLVGHAWHQDLPQLREEMQRATTKDQAFVALAHLQNSLRDGHCFLDPPPGANVARLDLGIEMWGGGTLAAPDLRVTGVAPGVGGDIRAGDAIVAVGGTPLAKWVAAHPFEAHSLAPADALDDVLSTVAFAIVPWQPVHAGESRTLTLSRAGKEHTVTLQFGHHSMQPKPSIDHPPPLADVGCEPIDYGDYAVSDVGINFCVYKPKVATRPRLAIVRYVSFLYSDPRGQDRDATLRMVKVDHELLAKSLVGVDRVILDLHENAGGNAPFMFLSWFTSGPLDYPRIVSKITELDEKTLRRVFDGWEAAGYLAARDRHEPTYVTHFYCANEPCSHVALPAVDRVTRAPVAVITGPGCVSSCDTFSSEWAAFHLGPIVGKQPRHAYTTRRLPIELEGLGTFRIAVSHNELRAGVPIEGEPIALDWEAPHTFDTRDSWVRDALVEAVKRL